MVFIDAGFFIAIRNTRDKFHNHARLILAEIMRGAHGKPLTCDYVLDEAVTRVRRQTKDHKLSLALAKEIYTSTYWVVRHVVDSDLKDAIKVYETETSCELTFTDCIV